MTNVFNKSVSELADEYWDRWNVETDFRTIKYEIINNNLRSKTKKQVELDIKFVFFINVISSYISNLERDKNILDHKKVNFSNCINKIVTFGLSNFLNNEHPKFDKMHKLIKNIINKKCDIVKGRKYIRRRVFPRSNWTRNGKIYENINKNKNININKNENKNENKNTNKNENINKNIIKNKNKNNKNIKKEEQIKEEQIKEKLYALVDIIIKTCGEKHTSLLLQIENIIKSEVNELVINN